MGKSVNEVLGYKHLHNAKWRPVKMPSQLHPSPPKGHIPYKGKGVPPLDTKGRKGSKSSSKGKGKSKHKNQVAHIGTQHTGAKQGKGKSKHTTSLSGKGPRQPPKKGAMLGKPAKG